MCAYRDVLGISLPSYDEYDTVRNHKVLAHLFTSKVPEWRKVPKATDGCVALIYRRGLPIHAGVVVGECYPDTALRTAHRVGSRAATAVSGRGVLSPCLALPSYAVPRRPRLAAPRLALPSLPLPRPESSFRR